MIRAAFVSKFVVNLRKVSNRAHPSFLLVLHSVPPTHQPPQPQHCLLPDKEVNCNYQSLSLPRATHSPLFDTFLSLPPSSLLSSPLPWLLGLAFFPPIVQQLGNFIPPVIISPPPPPPHNHRGHRLRRSKESTWRDEGRRNISLRSEFRETLLFDLMNEKCHCWKRKKKKKEGKKNNEHNANKYKFHRNARILFLFFFFIFQKFISSQKEERDRKRGRERGNRTKHTLVCPLTRFL